eukprot:TRINITY_DN3898_c0_g1_i3.p1 TRINITY_DN3898_c0_g1~~TRINITY_DN3898_c0_g1_i3.p1  ORF type:complete len:240 (-),score=36.07 TRINITY_DN3898_c0_g1_i3:273-992(-)
MTPLQLHVNRNLRWPSGLGELFPVVPFIASGSEPSDRAADRLFEIDTLRLILLRLLLLAHTREAASYCDTSEVFCGAKPCTSVSTSITLPTIPARGPFFNEVQKSFWNGTREPPRLSFEKFQGFYEVQGGSIRKIDSWITIPGNKGQNPTLIVIQNERSVAADGKKSESLQNLSDFFRFGSTLRASLPSVTVVMLWVTNRDAGFSEVPEFPGCYYITAENIAQFLPLLTHRYQPGAMLR